MFVCYRSLCLRQLPSFPTRRSSDLFRLGEVRTDELIGLYRELEFWGLLKTLHPQTNGESRREGRVQRLEQTPEFKRSEEHTSELQSLRHLVCRLLLEKKKKQKNSKA